MASSTTTLTLTPAEVIDAVRAARRTEQAAAAEQLVLALTWARLHPCPAGGIPAHWGEVDLYGETTTTLAGPGAPLVAEFAPADLAAALDLTHDQARALLGDALELGHRLPRLWRLVRTGVVPAWRARRIASETRDLCPEAAAYADRLIAATPHRIGQVRAAALVHEARLYFDPDRAIADEEAALARRGVWIQPGATAATTDLTMTLDTGDALLFDDTVARIAHDLRTLGDTTDLQVRRARAVGILADPQHALDLMSGREAAPSHGIGKATLYLHLTTADLTDPGGGGCGTIERLGAATTDLLTQWLARCTDTGGHATIRPVLDLSHETAVDAHDPPAAMRETVLLREAHCVFPGCRRDSRACDLDHITPYLPPSVGGPPGQTRPANLAPLCRTHHRLKTHTPWTYQRRGDTSYTWTSPTGHHYDVSPTPRHVPQPATPPHTDDPDRPPPRARRGHRHARPAHGTLECTRGAVRRHSGDSASRGQERIQVAPHHQLHQASVRHVVVEQGRGGDVGTAGEDLVVEVPRSQEVGRGDHPAAGVGPTQRGDEVVEAGRAGGAVPDVDVAAEAVGQGVRRGPHGASGARHRGTGRGEHDHVLRGEVDSGEAGVEHGGEQVVRPEGRCHVGAHPGGRRTDVDAHMVAGREQQRHHHVPGGDHVVEVGRVDVDVCLPDRHRRHRLGDGRDEGGDPCGAHGRAGAVRADDQAGHGAATGFRA